MIVRVRTVYLVVNALQRAWGQGLEVLVATHHSGFWSLFS